jgi:hypothetical protein
MAALAGGIAGCGSREYGSNWRLQTRAEEAELKVQEAEKSQPWAQRKVARRTPPRVSRATALSRR